MKTIFSAPLLALTFTVAGCGGFRSSPAWNVVTSHRGDASSSDAYALDLAQKLAAKGVEARVVKFRYAVSPDTAGITQTAVLYRDETMPSYPWFYTDSHVSKPIWLPNGTMEKQLRFVVHDRALEVLEAPETVAKTTTVKTSGGKNWEQLFERMHGTSYDANSSVDREKMAALKKPRTPTVFVQ